MTSHLNFEFRLTALSADLAKVGGGAVGLRATAGFPVIDGELKPGGLGESGILLLSSYLFEGFYGCGFVAGEVTVGDGSDTV